MYISKIRILNYKSFPDSGFIDFQPGINIIIGQNNSGKTALLECLSGDFNNIKNKNIDLSDISSEINIPESKATFILALTREEFKGILSNFDQPHNFPVVYDDNQLNDKTRQAVQDLLFIENHSPFFIELNLSPYKRIKLEYNCDNDLPYPYKQHPNQPGFYIFASIKNNLKTNLHNLLISVATIDNNIFVKIFKRFIENYIYRFYAERLNIGICKLGIETVLKPDASNLAEVIMRLQGGYPNKFHLLNKYVSTIFPDIKEVSADVIEGGNVEIKIWFTGQKAGKKDSFIQLSDCGTGVAQALAILYVILTADEPQTIIIDEPQSFLHPGAARKLIEIIKDFKQHQFFISTHSPEIITASNPSKIIQLTYKDGKTHVSEIDIKDKNDMQFLLADLGIRLSDVFGADNILWVEGPTEEKCFPLILENLTDIKLRGTRILALTATGDLEGKHADLVFDIYDKLSGGNTLFPPAIGFILDDEGKTDKDKDDLKRRSKKNGNELQFLTRRLYENYLLDAKAIAYVLNEGDKYREHPISKEDVQSWLDNNKDKFLPKGISVEKDWLKIVDGAKLLENLFPELTEARVDYRKTKDSYELTEWLVKNKPEYLQEIVALLKDFFKPFI